MNTTDWIPVLFDVAGKSAILLAGAATLTFLLRRSSSSVRHLIWLLAVGGLLCLPLSLALPKWQVPLGINENAFVLSAPKDFPTEVETQTIAGREIDQSVPHMEVSQSRAWLSLLIAIWLTGVILLLIQLLHGWLSIRHLLEICDPASDSIIHAGRHLEAELGIKRQVSILVVPVGRQLVPMTMGLLRPVIILPNDAGSWTMEHLRTVLLHELAHVRRGDFTWNALAQLSCTLYWFNPLIWLAVKRLRIESEHLVDEIVISHGIEPTDYAQILLDSVDHLGARNMGAEAIQVAMARQPEIKERLTEILISRKTRKSVSKGSLAFISAISTGLFILLAIIQPTTRAETGRDASNGLGTAVLLIEWSPISTEIQPGDDHSNSLTDESRVRMTERDGRSLQPASQRRQTSSGQPARSVQEEAIDQKLSPAKAGVLTELPAKMIISSESTALSPTPAPANSGRPANPARSGRPAKLPAPSQTPNSARPAH